MVCILILLRGRLAWPFILTEFTVLHTEVRARFNCCSWVLVCAVDTFIHIDASPRFGSVRGTNVSVQCSRVGLTCSYYAKGLG